MVIVAAADKQEQTISMDIADNTNNIKELLSIYDVDITGIAALSEYDKELVDFPEHVFNRYTYGVCFGFVLSKGILATVTGGPTPLYLHHYRQLNYRLDMTAYLLAKKIEEKGFGALPLAASQVVDWQHQRAHISHKRMAELAGLGWIGRNNLLVNPRFGAHVRYNTVLTDMPLAPDGPLCMSCGDCGDCATLCPAGSIKETPGEFDHLACFAMVKRFKNERNLGHYICGICVEACRGKR
jgi:epoxyqueuosine reductase